MNNSTLHELGLKFGTDKSYLHNFCHFYEKHLQHLRYEKIKLLEIGIYEGASLRMWQEYFPNAEIHGLDRDEYEDSKKIEGVRYHHITMDVEDKIVDFASNNFNWDIVIDDGGHHMHQQQYAFKHIWPTVKSKGFFIMEDLHTSVGNYAGQHGANVTNTLEMFSSLKDKIDFESPFISLETYKKHLSEVDFVEIWYKDILEKNTPSITSIVKKK